MTWHFCHRKAFPYIIATVGDRNGKSDKHLKELEMKLNTTCNVLGGALLLGTGELVLAT